MNMAVNITIKDEALGEGVVNEFILGFIATQVTVADIIRERVRHEVETYQQRTAEKRFAGLVQPSEPEVILNGHQLKKERRIDVEKQIEVALKAFQENGFFMLIDDLQAESLNQTVTLREDINVVFLKMVPLVGG